ncbi:hypothetical protein OO014_12410 [Intrasporangium calvum]|uniref:Lipoprotein n=1 Tax=Intrasporangium calvum TaxID=53358 RepID=A0ABT5GII3_9MICO|nr:hypothetical protein [Intrasporangium calvum]MDC5698063.1 hypothetical protein [Intrasporangium calvum]
MTIHARRAVVGVAIAAFLATAACSNPEAPSGTTTAPPPTATPTAMTTSTTAADPQLAGAEAAVARLWGLVDALGAAPKRSLDELTTVARDQSLEMWRELLTSQRRKGYRQTGSISVVSSTATSAGGKFNVDMCIDVSKTNLVDKDGKSVVAAGRPPRVRYTSVVEQGTDGKFYVMQDKAVGTC